LNPMPRPFKAQHKTTNHHKTETCKNGHTQQTTENRSLVDTLLTPSAFLKLANQRSESVSWWKVFSAVVVANVVSWVIVSVLAWLFWIWFFSALFDDFKNRTVSVPKTPSVITAPVVPKVQQPKPEPKERVFSRSAIAQNKKMCDFWTEQFRKDGLAESEAYRDLACIRYRKSLTTYKD